jgi:predicted short-subunit dehydrogenase-like oxidoreductase (DUF2520 family)
LSIKKRNIIIIGAGKIAHSIVPVLQKSGFNVASVISRKLDSAKTLADKFSIKYFSDNLQDFHAQNGIVFLCVPDTEIKITAKRLSKLNINFSKFIFVHLSGALDISCLDSLKKKNGHIASLHIMQTFPSKKSVPVKGCYAAVETNSSAVEKILFELAKSILLRPFALKSSAKAFYHIAGVFASNFLVGNFFNAETAFKKTGNNDIDFIELIYPIVFSTLTNIKNSGTANALSGPIERGDIDTIKKHLAVLRENASKTKNNSLLLNYIAQSLNLILVADKKYATKNKEAKKIKELLQKELNKL